MMKKKYRFFDPFPGEAPLKAFWHNIDQHNYTACTDKRLNSDLKELKAKVVEFILKVLGQEADNLSREDYRELLEVALICLGEIPPRGVQFRVPGAFHHAWWKSKLLCVLKVYVFQDQFPLTQREKNSCNEFAFFGALLYLKPWITCSNVSDAPHNDLKLIRTITH